MIRINPNSLILCWVQTCIHGCCLVRHPYICRGNKKGEGEGGLDFGMRIQIFLTDPLLKLHPINLQQELRRDLSTNSIAETAPYTIEGKIVIKQRFNTPSPTQKDQKVQLA